jgi:RND family efflux transporter MFP subunit
MSARAMLSCASLVALSLILAGCKDKETPPEPIRPVLSMVLKPVTLGEDSVVGVIEARITTAFSFRVLGRLITRTVYVGDTVEKGQVVAAIDPAALELAVRVAASEVSNGQAQQANAASAESRQRTLLGVDATSKAAFETIEQNRATADATLIRAQANLAKAREQLSYAQLQADFSGVVTAVGAEVGQVVSPGQMVVTIARPDVREAVIDVADDMANSLKIGTPFKIALQLDSSITAQGKVREIAPQADAATRTRRVRITLENPPETFRLGTTVIAIDAGSRNEALLVPESAILKKDNKAFVWVVATDSQTVATKRVEIAPSENGRVRIVSGVTTGERIVTAGVNSLKDGQKIRFTQEGAL